MAREGASFVGPWRRGEAARNQHLPNPHWLPRADTGAPWPLCPIYSSRNRVGWGQPKARRGTFPGGYPGTYAAPITGMSAYPQGQSWDKSFLLRGISTTTSQAQCPLPSSQLPEPPVLCQPNPKGHYCSNCPGEQCEALCGSTVPHCPADSGLLRWGSILLSHPDSRPQMPLLLPALYRNPQRQPIKHLPT